MGKDTIKDGNSMSIVDADVEEATEDSVQAIPEINDEYLSKYYSPTLQLQIIAELSRNPDVAVSVLPQLKPKYFDKDIYRQIITVLKAFVSKYKTVPTNSDNFIDYFVMMADTNKMLKLDDAAMTVIKAIYQKKEDGSWSFNINPELTHDMMNSFLKRVAYRDALWMALNELENGEEEKILPLLTKASMAGIKKVEDFEDFLARKLEEELSLEKSSYQLTNFKQVEKHLQGIQTGFIIIAGQTSKGKTIFLTNVFMDAVMTNPELTGIYISLDDNKKEIVNRFLSILTGIEMNVIKSGELRDNPSGLGVLLEEGYDTLKKLYREGRLIIKDISELESVADLELLICQHKDKKLMVALDGMYNLSTGEKRQDIRGDNIDRANQLKRLVDVYGIPLYATGEIRKLSKSNNIPSLDDLNETGKFSYNANAVIFVYPLEPENVKGNKEFLSVVEYAKNKQSGFEGKQTVIMQRYIGTMVEPKNTPSVIDQAYEKMNQRKK